jgi:hypothetical protein
LRALPIQGVSEGGEESRSACASSKNWSRCPPTEPASDCRTEKKTKPPTARKPRAVAQPVQNRSNPSHRGPAAPATLRATQNLGHAPNSKQKQSNTKESITGRGHFKRGNRGDIFKEFRQGIAGLLDSLLSSRRQEIMRRRGASIRDCRSRRFSIFPMFGISILPRPRDPRSR